MNTPAAERRNPAPSSMPQGPTPRRLLLCLAAAALAGCALPPAPKDATPAQPEAATGFTAKSGWATRKFAVAAANPLATEAGYRVLRPVAPP